MIERAFATREGDDYVYTWEEAQVSIVIRAVRESHGEPYGEVTAYFLKADGGRGHICGPTRHSLVGSETRGKIAKLVFARFHDAGDQPDWERRAEQAFALTVEQLRAGEDAVVLGGDEPLPGPRQWLFEPVIALNETTMIYADGGAGKGYVALQLAAHLALGQDVAAGALKLCQPPGVTLYCDWETNQQAVSRRWRRITDGLAVTPRPTLVYLPMQRSLTQDADRLRRWTHESGASLVVIDSVGFAAEHDLTSSEAATRMFGVCSRLGVTVLLLHHMNKAVAGQKQGHGEAYGTIYFRNSARGSWEMRSDQVGPDDKIIAMYDQKGGEGAQRLRPVSFRLHFDGAEGPVTITRGDVRESVELNARRPLPERLVELLGKGARPLRDCLAELELPEERMPALQVAANRLMNRGRLVKLEGDLWGLAQDVPPVVQWHPRAEPPPSADDLGEPEIPF